MTKGKLEHINERIEKIIIFNTLKEGGVGGMGLREYKEMIFLYNFLEGGVINI